MIAAKRVLGDVPGSLIGDLQQRLDAFAIPAKREWWERYLKGSARFRGVAMADVRTAANAWLDEHDLSSRLGPDGLHRIALALLAQPLTEDKLAGTLVYGEHLIPQGHPDWRVAVSAWAEVFAAEDLGDWNSCDWFCVKAISPLVLRDGAECAEAVAAWKDAAGLWQRRASVVGFVGIASRGDGVFPGFVDLVLDTCSTVVRSDERFAQTGVGWVVREISVADPDRAAAFVADHLGHLSREAARSAVRKLPPEVARPLLDRHAS
jgi:3-methyladenine DNA glycosylase AlkD